MAKKKINLHTERTFEILRVLGWEPWVVEKFNMYAGPFGVRQDMYGCIDVVAIPARVAGRGIIAIQMCSQSSYASHVTKLALEPRLAMWLRAGDNFRFEIWAWAKKKLARGGKAEYWACNRYTVKLDHNGNLVFSLASKINKDHPWMKKAAIRRKAIRDGILVPEGESYE
jgi:hypothetical protein